jgi:hypothetical protein
LIPLYQKKEKNQAVILMKCAICEKKTHKSQKMQHIVEGILTTRGVKGLLSGFTFGTE